MISAFTTRAICFLSTRVKCAGAFHLWQASIPKGTWTGITQLFWRAKEPLLDPQKMYLHTRKQEHQHHTKITTHLLDQVHWFGMTLFPWNFFSSVTFNNLKLEYLLIFLCDPKTTPSFQDYICEEFRIMDYFLNQQLFFYGFFVHCSLYASWYKPGNMLI